MSRDLPRLGLLRVGCLALVLVSFIGIRATAQVANPTPTDIWTANAAGSWATAGNWSTGAAPASSATADLSFPAVGAIYTANDNIAGTFQDLGLQFDDDSSSAVTLTGNALSFQTSGSFINQNNADAVIISNALAFTNTSSGSSIQVGGIGAGSVTLGGVLSGAGGIIDNGLTPITVTVSNALNTFGTGVTYSHQMANAGGVFQFTGSAAAGKTPLGNTAITGQEYALSAGTFDIAPSGSNGAVTETIGTSNFFLSDAGGLLELNKGTNTSLKVTADALLFALSSGATNAGADGTLTLVPASGIANLGTANGEMLSLTAAQANKGPGTTGNVGIVVPTIIGQSSATDSTGNFLTYGAAGFTGLSQFTASTVYNTPGGPFSSSVAGTEISAVTANTTTTGNASVFAASVSNSALTISVANTVTLVGGAYNAGHNNEAGLILNNTSSPASIAGPGTLAFGSSEADIYVSAGTATISAPITSSAVAAATTSSPAIVKFGPGNLALTGANTFASGAAITIYGGNLTITAPSSGDPASLGTNPITIDLGGGGGFQLIGGSYAPTANVKFAMVTDSSTASYLYTGGGTLDVEGSSNTLTLAQSGQFADVTTSDNGNPLYKTGAGTLVFGSGFVLSSPTVINAGMLAINATTTGTGQVVVNNSGTLGGTGTVGGRVTLTSGGTIEPGTASSIAKFTATGGAVFYPSGVYQFAYNPDAVTPVAGTDNDEISSTSTLDLSNLSATNQFDLNLDPTNSDTPGVTYTAGAFSSFILPTGVTAANVGTLFDITGTYSGIASVTENGTLLQVTFTPEPASLSLLALAGAGLMVRRRRRGL